MSAITAKHKSIKAFYDHRERLKGQNITNEMGVREAFKTLLADAARLYDLELVVEQTLRTEKGTIRPDGILRDDIRRDRGYWESKDTRDDLKAEIERKLAVGYSNRNTIFEDTNRAVLYQHGDCVGEFDLNQPDQVARLLDQFFSYTEPVIEKFDQAVEKFKEEAPNLARNLLEIIEKAHKDNKAFKAAFADFYELCKQTLNPNISPSAVNEMLIQHLLTERLMRTVFDNPDFARRNAIAAEVEKVIDALTLQSFSRSQFLNKLDFFYEAIEITARTIYDFSSKQRFINNVYERFFQGYSVKVADTHGIVYTPQEIVDFMCAAVEEVLEKEFGKALWDDDVYLIDPCTGTGNFIVNLLRRIHGRRPDKLPDVYKDRLFANEVMLLPYYVASLNIEHEFMSLTGQYAPFEGLCFVDTLDLAEGKQMAFSFMTEKNSERVERQKKAPITVIIGNPPYNVGQLNENDNNKNRAYPVIDKRVRDTYAKDSRASNKNALYDAYVKFFRWASDRLQGRDGVVCYVSNNSFVDQIAFDGMRKHLLQDFTTVYHLDLHGNVRQNPKLSGTTHNVFGIQVGVGITIAIRSSKHSEHQLLYHRVPEFWRREEKLDWLREPHALSFIQPHALSPVQPHTLDQSTKQAHALSPVQPHTLNPSPRTQGEGLASKVAEASTFPIANSSQPMSDADSSTPLPMQAISDADSLTPLPMFGEGQGVGFVGAPEHRMESTTATPKGWAISYTNTPFYDKIKPLARQMRTEPTLAEKKLWDKIRHKRLADFKFRRQHVIDRFIVDFYCAEARLVIEVDGEIHEYTKEEDALRQAYLESLGLRVLRFKNEDVLLYMDGVLERIGEALMEGDGMTTATPPPAPPRTQGGESRMVEKESGQLNRIPFTRLIPDARHTWRVAENADEFTSFIAIGGKETKSTKAKDVEAIFKTFSGGVKTNRDEVVYDFEREKLSEEIIQFIEAYNAEVDRYKRSERPNNVDNFVRYEIIKWSESLKNSLRRSLYAEYKPEFLRISLYRPFTRQFLYFDPFLVERRYLFPHFLPTSISENENRVIWLKVGGNWSMFPLMANTIVDLLPEGGSQCFPFYVYDEDGTNRRENITDWALNQFQTHYNDPTITKWDIFYYVYALLHHPDYRERYKDNLKRDLPRIPFVSQQPHTLNPSPRTQGEGLASTVAESSPFPMFGEGQGMGFQHEEQGMGFQHEEQGVGSQHEGQGMGFHLFAQAGKQLAELHLNYETVKPYELEYLWKTGKAVSWRVEKMRLAKDKSAVTVNDSLTLRGIPAAAFEYRLGNRSALDWVIDQYQVKTDKRSGITSDPNRYSDDEKYIVELVGRVVRVSVETVTIVKSLPAL